MIRVLAMVFWLIPWALAAQMVPAFKAAEIAWSTMGGKRLAWKTHLEQDSVIPFGEPGLPALFVVTFKPGGFVVVSAVESRSPVLGYSLTSSFPADPRHPLRNWLIPLYQSSVSSSVKFKSGSGARFFTGHDIRPLITAQWGQGDPWNRFCPADSSGKKALVGCVAVAMSQIMEKWQWPEKGTGEITYTPMQHSEYGNITVNFDTTRYRWDLMHDMFPTEAAALILYHTGAASLMNYDPVLSSTSIDGYAMPALKNNFSYNRDMVFHAREGFSFPAWIGLLRQELSNSRPVLYSGTSPDGKSSHAFNIDGYRNETFFHFNWGWNGAGDGWYSLEHMAGGGADFSSQQAAVFGLQPAGMPVRDRPSGVEVLPGDGFVQMFWDPLVLNNFSNFNIYRDDTLVGQTSGSGFRDESVENGHAYNYRITSYCQGENPGESFPTENQTVIPWARMVPAYSQDFESGTKGWYLQDAGSGFRIGTATGFGIGENTGTVAAILSEGYPSGEQTAGYLISPLFYPGDFSHPAVSFDYVFRQNPGTDQLSVIWRDCNSREWHTLAELDSTGGYSDWRNLHLYLPTTSDNGPIQIAFYYNDFFGQGYGAAIDNLTVYEVAEPGVPLFSADIKDVCLHQPVIFSDQSLGQIQSWDWDFGEGAEPRHASTQGPHLVTYTTAGKKTVRISLNHLDHLAISDYLTIREQPVAGFTFVRKFQEISFTDQSKSAETLFWDFGDGTTSTDASPVHTYYTKSLFEVKQVAGNGTCDPDTLKVSIDMRNGTGISEEDFAAGFHVFPNPTDGKVTLLCNILSPEPLMVKIISITGQSFLDREYPAQKEIGLDLSRFPEGIYILQISSGKLFLREQILKINN